MGITKDGPCRIIGCTNLRLPSSRNCVAHQSPKRRPRRLHGPIGLGRTGEAASKATPVPEGLRRLLYEFHYGHKGD